MRIFNQNLLVNLTIFLMVLVSPTLAASGDLDLTFGLNGKVITDVGLGSNSANDFAIQSDGKIVAIGYSVDSNNDVFAIARYNTDGSLDTTLDGDGKTTTAIGISARANSVAIQTDGKIVVAGSANNSGNADFAVVRYNQDGSLDTTFGVGGKVTTPIGVSNELAYSVKIQANNKIVLVGYSIIGANSNFAIARYNSNGSLDTTFDLDGIVTTSIGTNNANAYSSALQTDGKIVIAGSVSNSLGNFNDFAVARYNTNGSLDTTFGNNGIVITSFGSGDDLAFSVAIQVDGKILVVGEAQISVTNFAVARYNSNGSLDTTFDIDGKVITTIGNFASARSVAIQADNKIVVAGSARSNSPFNDFAIVRYNSDGSLDNAFTEEIEHNSFGNGGKVLIDFSNSADTAYSVKIDSNGKILVCGRTDNFFALARLQTSVPTAANVSISGRVLTSEGRALRNALVNITDGEGQTRTVRTATFGYFRFDEVQVGQTVILSVISKGYRFNSQLINVTESLDNVLFTPIP